ncbi:MAG: PSD1 and planctomycete cytochrome C domain-containing protein [Pirellulaceae bacterium]|nr:PSD1 and planctomycete cytochrome C domain-containing protein [Pirellulaceae bacterium]
MNHFLACATLLCVGLATANAVGQADVDFNRDIRPILSDNCFQCHGPDENHREADLRLDVKDGVLAGDPPIVHPHDVDGSALFVRITTGDPDQQMPPRDSGKQLTEQQVELIQRWIQQGAVWQEHWSFLSPIRPKPPATTTPVWSKNKIDQFVLSRLESLGRQPSPEAGRRTLIRRLYFDLTGLPPQPVDVEVFLRDDRADAYERLVDRLLDSAHFGERMAVAWLDQARFADTNGYSIDGGRQMWLWRDWVINAYNQNLPFDQFVIQQLAGDLLAEATLDQRVATAFNRNHMITHEGGTIPAENLVNYVADRVKTTSEAFLGLTMACAQCHDHKYDPITQRDYYRFFAYFNTLSDRGLDGDRGINATPKLKAKSVLGANQTEIAELQRELSHLRSRLLQPSTSQPEWESSVRSRLATLGQDFQLHPVEVRKVSSPNRAAAYDVAEDGTVFLPNGAGRSPSISAKINVDNITGLRLVFYPDEKFPQQGIGHGKGRGMDGSLVLTAFSASATKVAADQVDLYGLLAIKRATASNSHPDYPAEDSLDERDANGWSPHPNNQESQHITYQLEKPLHASESPYVTVMLVWGAGSGLTGGKYRLFAVTGNDQDSEVPQDVREALQVSPSKRSPQMAELVRAYHAEVSEDFRNVRYRIQNLEERWQHLTEEHEVMVMDIANQPRETFMLNRGQYDQPTEKVDPGTPASLPPLPADAPANRLGLARWLTQPDHPLTSRVAVNRLWQMLFGTGLVKTSADLGSQGEPPTHPQLLDWLAVEFVESGWDVKSLLKQLVMSATYRQSSNVTKRLLAADPENRWLARGPRFRLQAEFVRDNALAVSGLLVPRIGGPSVKPYQPYGLWKEVSHYGSTPATAQVFVQDHGDDLYRRSMYTFWKRTVPPPAMISFDAPNREICTVRRLTTNTPLQALVLLNDPQFVESSRALGQKIILQGGSDLEAKIRFAFAAVVAREPLPAEAKLVQQAFQREFHRFQENPSAAHAYLQIGESDFGDLPVAEHAAWSSVAMLLLNLSETITKG